MLVHAERVPNLLPVFCRNNFNTDGFIRQGQNPFGGMNMMKKLFAIAAAAAVIGIAAPAAAQSINVRIGDGYRHHHPHHGYYAPRKKVVVIKERHRHWDRGHHYGRAANRAPIVVYR
jgi:hypothetical protein